MKTTLKLLAFLLATAALAAFWESGANGIVMWQRQVRPGNLSAAHASLENNCAACHTSVKGPVDVKCIGCHANNETLLQRQPTAFHVNIGNCAQCHIEHQGTNARLTRMDHVRLAQIGLTLLERAASESEQKQAAAQLLTWVRQITMPTSMPNQPSMTALEMTLNCSSCHSTKDRHVGLFGAECSQCNGTEQWTIAEYRHPSARSLDCAQCHQAPPSHYMEHFEMISKRIARQEDAQVAQCCGGPVQVNQCYRCHQTTSWNDIKGVGYYKHH
jgi:predicted CXXCH cytochrome family protein